MRLYSQGADFDAGMAMMFLAGHWARVGLFVAFPHVCPGTECAIERWIRAKTS